MKNVFYFFVLFLAVSCMAGCGGSNNGQGGDGYRIVYISNDGSEKSEKIEAANDTDAVKQFTQKVMAMAMSNLDKKEPPYKGMYVISPSGDTLNKNDELLNAATGLNLGKMADEAESLSGKLNDGFKLSEELDKAIMDGDKKKADSIRAEMDKIKFDDK